MRRAWRNKRSRCVVTPPAPETHSRPQLPNGDTIRLNVISGGNFVEFCPADAGPCADRQVVLHFAAAFAASRTPGGGMRSMRGAGDAGGLA